MLGIISIVRGCPCPKHLKQLHCLLSRRDTVAQWWPTSLTGVSQLMFHPFSECHTGSALWSVPDRDCTLGVLGWKPGEIEDQAAWSWLGAGCCSCCVEARLILPWSLHLPQLYMVTEDPKSRILVGKGPGKAWPGSWCWHLTFPLTVVPCSHSTPYLWRPWCSCLHYSASLYWAPGTRVPYRASAHVLWVGPPCSRSNRNDRLDAGISWYNSIVRVIQVTWKVLLNPSTLSLTRKTQGK